VPDLADRIWASGFFDGEGCVNITRSSKNLVKAQALLTNTDLAVLEWFRDRWGGFIYTHKPGTQRQPAWQWHPSEGGSILPFLEDIRPYMKVKVAQTDNCIAFLRLRQQRRKHSYLTAAEKVAYDEFLANHRALDLTRGGQRQHGQHVIRDIDDPRRSRAVG
jgi:hypothetical protein